MKLYARTEAVVLRFHHHHDCFADPEEIRVIHALGVNDCLSPLEPFSEIVRQTSLSLGELIFQILVKSAGDLPQKALQLIP